MTELTPCPSCQRHVRATSAACPFCHAALVPGGGGRRGPSGRRLGRYASFTFQSSLVAAAIACNDDSLVSGTGGQPGTGGAGTGGLTASGGASSTGGVASGGDAFGGDGGQDGGTGGSGPGGDDLGVPIYSAVPWVDGER